MSETRFLWKQDAPFPRHLIGKWARRHQYLIVFLICVSVFISACFWGGGGVSFEIPITPILHSNIKTKALSRGQLLVAHLQGHNYFVFIHSSSRGR